MGMREHLAEIEEKAKEVRDCEAYEARIKETLKAAKRKTDAAKDALLLLALDEEPPLYAGLEPDEEPEDED